MKTSDICYRDFEEMLDREGWYITTVRGRSMFPMLRPGVDPIIIKRPEGRLKPYDVAVYRVPGKYIVHRVLEVSPDHYIIRGDNCIGKEYVRDSQIVGIMTGFWRGDKFIEVTSKGYLRYAHFWVAINPLVKLWHGPRFLASRLFHRIFGPDIHPIASLRNRMAGR